VPRPAYLTAWDSMRTLRASRLSRGARRQTSQRAKRAVSRRGQPQSLLNAVLAFLRDLPAPAFGYRGAGAKVMITLIPVQPGRQAAYLSGVVTVSPDYHRPKHKRKTKLPAPRE
jgi:hypothetical protein